ncbi:hypothetical protein HU200_039443 [Digitaria exilis]|uniref:DUF1618 domain-containing protein n=1 Tax=Digitaria exilis TaxID=1010633 RepID=A0A835EKW0_9POAL|nr:hypothetical protein HU200_039443 [Digitaria exilis]
MAAADSSTSSGALPNWVMLERFIFRRDDPETFREDKRTTATGETSAGAGFRVSFILAEPPTPSRLYLSWPGGPKRERMCHLVAAHRSLVLLRLDSFVDPSNTSPFGEVLHDYFIYIADHTPAQAQSSTPVLRRVPSYTKYNAHYERARTFPFESPGVGLFCSGGEFAVAYLNVCLGDTSEEELDSPLTLGATLWVLRSIVSDDSAGGGEKWEVKSLPIHLSRDDEYKPLLSWKTNEVVPFKDGLCWVDYNSGILHCEGICGDNPKVSFIKFPRNIRCHSALRSELYRSLCVTGGGQTLVFLDVGRHDGAALGPMAPGSGFTIR